jgi:chromosome segregation ATPase
VTELAQVLGPAAQLLTCLVAIGYAVAHYTRKRGDAIPIEAQAKASESEAEATNAKTLAQVVTRQKEQDDELDELRDEVRKCHDERAAEKLEATKSDAYWRGAASEAMSLASQRTELADEIRRFNEKQVEITGLLVEIRDVAKQKSQPRLRAAVIDEVAPDARRDGR